MLRKRNLLPASVLRILRSERGEVGTAEGEPTGDPGEGTTAPPSDAPPAETPATDDGDKTEAAPETPAEESFVDPATLPPELKAHWKRMHGSFTKRMQEVREIKDKAGSYDRFFSDPAYAKQIVAAIAPQLGLQFAPQADRANGNGATATPPASDVPRELVEAVRTHLPEELKWMAEGNAAAFWAANKLTLAPVLQKQKQDEIARRTSEYEALATELSEAVPTWEDREGEMSELLDFIKSDQLRHPKFGNKLQVLFNAVTGGAQAVQEASRRMSQAARSRTTTGRPATSTIPNIAERTKAAKSDQEAWDIAAKAAIEQIRGTG